MIITFLANFKNTKRSNQWWSIALILIFQTISIYLMAIGVLPTWVAWINFGLLAILILFSSIFYGLSIFILSIPFFIVLPNAYFETLSMWRPLIVILFLRACFEYVCSSVITRSDGFGATRQSIWRLILDCFVPKRPRNDKIQRLLLWEKLAILLFLWAGITLLWAKFPGEGVKQLLFIANAALMYPVTVISLRQPALTTALSQGEREKEGGGIATPPASRNDSTYTQLLKTLAISCGMIIVIGFGQLVATLFVDLYYFWQFWAGSVSSLYYGQSLADVLLYSNSWLGAGLGSLRMFSIMPSSHAFAMVCVMFFGFTVALFKKGNPFLQRATLFFALVFTALAVALSGTRGVWVGMLPVLGICIWLSWKNYSRSLLRPLIVSMLLILAFIAASPAINYGLSALRAGMRGDSFGRAISIIDLDEESNVGRLQIWKESLSFALHHPLGVGFDNFITTLNGENKPLDEFADERNKRYNLPQKYITAHSLYLQLLVELSVVGLVIFILMWRYYFRDIILLFRPTPEFGIKGLDSGCPPAADSGMIKGLVPTLSLVFLWLLIYSIFDLTWMNDKILLYTFVSFGLVRSVLNKQNNSIYGTPSPK